MKSFKTVKKGSICCLIFAVLFVCAAVVRIGGGEKTAAYAQETDVRSGLSAEVMSGETELAAEEVSEEAESAEMKSAAETGLTTEEVSAETEFFTETMTSETASDKGEAASEQGDANETEAGSEERQEVQSAGEASAEIQGTEEDSGETQATEKAPEETQVTEEAPEETQATEKAPEETQVTEEVPEETQATEEVPEETQVTEEVSEETQVTEEMTDTQTDLSFLLDENWQDCMICRQGLRARLANPTVHRDDSMIFSFLDFPCYFKYVTGHGQDVGKKTLAAYCVYNTREAPEDELYKPDGRTAFSKEITYCLYNGCRYKGKTAYNSNYSTGSWKKDYYVTQIAIHLINYEQGRESSIEKYLNKSKDKEVYNLVKKMVKDAKADTSLTSSITNQTQEVTYTVTPASQAQWVKMADGNWRTKEDYSCSSNAKDQVISVIRSLGSDTPEGVTLVAADQNDPMSSFYLQATPAAYRRIGQSGQTVTINLQVTSEEYGGWWYEPADSSVKRQYITYLALEAEQIPKERKVTATADYLEQKASLTVYKEGEVLTDASVSEDGVQFQYAKTHLAGAGFELRAGEDIKNGAGEVIWKKDAVVAANLVTNAQGSVTVEGLCMGNYYLVEKTAPTGMIPDAAPHRVTLTPENDTAELTISSVTVENQRQKAEVKVEKTDSATKQPLSGAVFGIFAAEDIRAGSNGQRTLVPKDTLIATAMTNADGTALFKTDLPVGCSYYVKEIQAPYGYVRDESEQYSFSVLADSGKPLHAFTYTCTNTSCRAVILLQKKDKETKQAVPQGDAVLAGARYGLFAREEILHPDGHTGVLFQKDQQVAVLETDERGQAKAENLYLGSYYLKELSAPEGYVLDEAQYDVVLEWENDTTVVFQKTAVVEEQVKKQSFQLIKRSDKGEENPEALAGAGFTVWKLSDLEESSGESAVSDTIDEAVGKTEGNNTTKEIEGQGNAADLLDDKSTMGNSLGKKSEAEYSYDTAGILPIVIGPNGETELFTDENGYLCTIPLPYGTYLVRETTVPKNHKMVKDFLVTISEHSPDVPQPWCVLLDEAFMAKLKIIKKDRISGKEILIPGAEFRVKNLDTGTYVEQRTSYPEEKVHTSYVTNEQGYLVLPKELAPGRYQIEEITAPEGYVRNSEPVEFEISEDKPFLEDTVNGEIVVCQEIYNEPVKGNLKIQKVGEVLTGFDGAFQYEEKPLSGVTFELLAEEDILPPDGQSGQMDTENDAVLYKKGTVAAEVTTDENGLATVENLPLGIYRIREKQAPFSFITDTEGVVVKLSYQDQETPVVTAEQVYRNERQKIRIIVEKKDQETGSALSGAVFGLYAGADIRTAEGKLILQKGTRIGQTATREDGTGTFALDLPHGIYFVKEEAAPEGYVADSQEYLLDLSDCDGRTSVISQIIAVKNQKEEPEQTETESEAITETETETKQTETEPPELETEAESISPKAVETGDHTDVFGLLCLLFLSGEAFLVLLFLRRKLK